MAEVSNSNAVESSRMLQFIRDWKFWSHSDNSNVPNIA